MKNLKFTLVAFIILFTLQVNAQFSINLSLGSRAQYPNHYRNNDITSYYYLPEIEAYYDVNSALFIYNGPRGWVRSTNLPEYCSNYDINRGYKVALNYRGNSPYANFNYDRQKYYRNNNRNYKEEYYRGRRDRRNDYVEASKRNRYNNNGTNRNYYREERNKDDDRENRHENHGYRD